MKVITKVLNCTLLILNCRLFFLGVMAGNQNVNLDITPSCLNYFKYALITSVDVERTFSLYKHTLSYRRYNFQEQNLKMYIGNYTF